jgi:hypothetical protein
MYYGCPVQSVKYVRKMLKSCDNRNGEEGEAPTACRAPSATFTDERGAPDLVVLTP